MPVNDPTSVVRIDDPTLFDEEDVGTVEYWAEHEKDIAYSGISSLPGLREPERTIMISADRDYIEELKKLAELRNNGVLNDEEFQKEKKEVLYRANKVDTIKCTYCGSPAEAFLDKCPACGAPLKADKGA